MKTDDADPQRQSSDERSARPGSPGPPHPEGSEAVSDLDLTRGLAAGDVGSLSRVYDAYGVHVYSVALRMLRDPQQAEDVVFDCFLELWQHAGEFDPERASVRGHLISSARQLALDRLKGQTRSGAGSQSLGPNEGRGTAPDPWDGAATSDVGKAVREGLARLPSDQREALELACFSGYSYREIADATHTPVTSVKSAMRLALEKLHSFLQVRGLVPEA
jgi:RNA polymerase sigma-70 factor (ECF subfamily)